MQPVVRTKTKAAAIDPHPAAAVATLGTGILTSLLFLAILLLAGCGGRGPAPATGDPALTGPSAEPPPPIVLRDPTEPSRSARLVYLDPDDTLIPLTEEVRAELDPDQRFSLGLDRMVRQNFESLDHKRVAVVTSRLAIDSEGTHLLESLLPQAKPIVSRVIVFGDELPYPARSRAITRIVGAYPSVRVFERSHRSFTLTSAMLDDVEIVLIDLPLRAATSFPEVGFFAQVLQDASLRGLPVIVLDRPNPVSGNLYEGPVGDGALHGRISAFYPDMLVMGLTTGELARFYDQQFGLNLDLEVVEMLNWGRSAGCAPLQESFDQLGIDPTSALPDWLVYCPPSPRVAQLHLMAHLLPSGRATVEVPEEGNPRLVLDPAPQEPDAFRAAFRRFGIGELADSEEDGRVVLEASALLAEAVFASAAIWSVFVAGDASLLPEAGEPGHFGTPVVLNHLRQGRDPRETRRLWTNDPAMNDLEARRARLLR